MTPLQRFRLILLIVVCMLFSVLVIEHFLDNDGSFPFFLPGLIVLPWLGYSLWKDWQGGRSGNHVVPFNRASERRFVITLSLAIVGLLVVPLIMLFTLQDILSPNVMRNLFVGVSTMLTVVVIVYVIWSRIKHRT